MGFDQSKRHPTGDKKNEGYAHAYNIWQRLSTDCRPDLKHEADCLSESIARETTPLPYFDCIYISFARYDG